MLVSISSNGKRSRDAYQRASDFFNVLIPRFLTFVRWSFLVPEEWCGWGESSVLWNRDPAHYSLSSEPCD
jgi:hypothetical protein